MAVALEVVRALMYTVHAWTPVPRTSDVGEAGLPMSLDTTHVSVTKLLGSGRAGWHYVIAGTLHTIHGAARTEGIRRALRARQNLHAQTHAASSGFDSICCTCIRCVTIEGDVSSDV
jgi:hypothetical protein